MVELLGSVSVLNRFMGLFYEDSGLMIRLKLILRLMFFLLCCLGFDWVLGVCFQYLVCLVVDEGQQVGVDYFGLGGWYVVWEFWIGFQCVVVQQFC